MRNLVLGILFAAVTPGGNALQAVTPPPPTPTPGPPACAYASPCLRVACGGACEVIFDERLAATPTSVLLTLPDFSKETGRAGAHIAQIGWYGNHPPVKAAPCQYAKDFWRCNINYDEISLKFAPQPARQPLVVQQSVRDHVVFANQLVKDDIIKITARTLFVGSLLNLQQGYFDAFSKDKAVDHWDPPAAGKPPAKPASGVVAEISLPVGSGNVTVGFGANSVTIPYNQTEALYVTLTNLRKEDHSPRKVGAYYPDDDFGLHCSVLANCPDPFPIPFFDVAPLSARGNLNFRSWEGGDCFVGGFDGPGVFNAVLDAFQSQQKARSLPGVKSKPKK